ncbi:hypothetical protein [Kangiella sediminilitoris]|uniref:hypothetical protein n=1 Tax=Kangiella sediminilitoris TaxID=1144748 RepID=UPI001471347C|nr:hypothetical protein [Kangiella sediminilitoris]
MSITYCFINILAADSREAFRKDVGLTEWSYLAATVRQVETDLSNSVILQVPKKNLMP